MADPEAAEGAGDAGVLQRAAGPPPPGNGVSRNCSGWRRCMWGAGAAVAVICIVLYTTSSVILDRVPGTAQPGADLAHLPSVTTAAAGAGGNGSRTDGSGLLGGGSDDSASSSSGSDDSTTSGGGSGGGAATNSGISSGSSSGSSGSSSGSRSGADGAEPDALAADGPRHPMSGEAMARVLARPWPKDVYAETSSNSKLCHGRKPVNLTALAARRVCLVVVSYRAPLSLANSVRSWHAAGLLDLVDDKIMWLNAATDEERALGAEFGFRVLEPRNMTYRVFKTDFPQAFKGRRPQRLTNLVVGSDRNSWTVGPSLVHAADMTDADYVLFLEKDFMIEDHVRALFTRRTGRCSFACGLAVPVLLVRSHTCSRWVAHCVAAMQVHAELVRAELLNALLYLERGVKIVRLRQRRDQGQVGFPDCCKEPCVFMGHGLALGLRLLKAAASALTAACAVCTVGGAGAIA